MKKIILFTVLILAGSVIIWSQVPQAMNYKAIAKDDWGVALPNKTITLRFTILQGGETGSIVYQETHRTTTNKFGLMDVEIGKGTPSLSTFDLIDWSKGIYYIRIEMDPNGGTNFRLEDPAHQLLSVPYALYAGASGNANFSETDPFFVSSPASGIWSSDILNWNSAFGWGNHANEGYLKSFVESDPIFLIHPAHGIASEDINNWNTAFGWGDHAGLYRPISYVPTWSDITGNPFLLTSPEANQLLRFNSVSGKWENWIPNFLITEIDGSVTNEIQTLTISGNAISLSDGGGTVTLPGIGGQYYYVDRDADSYGDQYSPIWVPSGVQAPLHFVADNTDCSDNNAFVHPDLPEIDDDIDNNCDGLIDEGIPVCSPGSIEYRSCGGGVGVCFKSGTQTRICGPEGFWSDWSICEGETLPSSEICDGKDNDCDGQTDEGVLCPNGQCIAGVCVEVDIDGDGYTVSEGDCNDYDALIKPSAIEVFNHMDDNCNGIVDEGFVCTPSSYEPNESCNQSFYLGEVVDTYGEFITRTGNFTDPYDVDWFRVLATDASDFLSESFIVRINLISNPGSAYAFDIYKSDCSHPVAYSVTDYVEDGTFGMEDTNSYYIKVYLKYPSYPRNCDTYTIRMSNGEE